MSRKILTSCLSIVLVISFTFGLINSAIALQNKDTFPSVEITKQETLSPRKKQECDPNYSGACIPVYPPDVDCGEIPSQNFLVVGTDVHRLDRDQDGIACESYR